MNAYHKMNFISVSTGTTYMDWVHAYNENKMAKFQLAIIAMLGKKAGI